MLKINRLEMHGIGGIGDLTLRFGGGLNLLCGPNGIGKTTILECIGHSFSNHMSSFLRRNVKYERGSWRTTADVGGTERVAEMSRTTFHPREQGEAGGGLYDYASEVIVFKTQRSFVYQEISAITKDPVKDKNTSSHEASQGSQAHDAKQWFLNRYVWSKHEGLLSPEQLANLELARQCFGMLDPGVSFGRVVPTTHDILVSTSEGNIYFEYLSSGYRSCLYVLLGLIKEIEFRFPDSPISAPSFSGVVLIDEIDLHLHPQWQAKLVQVLKRLLPNAQIIATTHSPHMIQAAEPDEIIPLGYDDQHHVIVRSVERGRYGFQGWTVEEILTDVMGLDSVRSEQFETALATFDTALESRNRDLASGSYLVLEAMLHVRNPLRKLLKLQLAELGGPVE